MGVNFGTETTRSAGAGVSKDALLAAAQFAAGLGGTGVQRLVHGVEAFGRGGPANPYVEDTDKPAGKTGSGKKIAVPGTPPRPPGVGERVDVRVGGD